MKYRPLAPVEHHYHIQELIEGQEKRSAERTRFQQIEKERYEHENNLATYKDIETLDFYCENCDMEFVARAKKQIDSWEAIAYYKIKHRCGKWCIRHITHRFRDKYFFKSRQLARERADRTLDTIQPFENNYNLVYGKK